MAAVKSRKGLIFLISTMSLCAFSAHYAFTDRFNTQQVRNSFLIVCMFLQRMHDGLLREMNRIKADRFGNKNSNRSDIDS